MSQPRNAALRSFEAQWLASDASSSDDALSVLRGKAMAQVLQSGLPTQRDESWRYTNLRHLAAQSFAPAAGSPADGRSVAAEDSWLGAEATVTQLVIDHGQVLESTLSSNINGLQISSLESLSRTNPEKIAALLEPLSGSELARWSALNTALFVDGLYLHITGELTTPLIIEHRLRATASQQVAFPRVIVECEPGSAATLIERYVGDGMNLPLCNSATRLKVGRGARLEHYRVFSTGDQAEHIDSLNLSQDADSHCTQFTIVLGGALVRSSLEASLNQPGASLENYSLLVGHEARHVDCVNVVTHAARNTTSRQTARAIASGESRVVFNTKVVVESGAAHAESQQSCRGLLLSPKAEIDTRPQLEIHADEVKCAHGATIGRLDPDMLFYMLSRGLDRETAQSLLVYAFLADVLTHMAVPPARSAIEQSLIAQLPDSHLLNKFR